MNGTQHRNTELSLNQVLLLGVRIVAGLIVFPIVTLLSMSVVSELLSFFKLSQNHENAQLTFAFIASALIGLSVATLTVLKSGGVFRNLLVGVRTRIPEPAHSCIEFGVVGALLFGGIMLAGILLLGHTRPTGWDFNRVLPSMAVGFTLFLIGGLPVGLWRRRRGR
jgi:hypothetical protein